MHFLVLSFTTLADAYMASLDGGQTMQWTSDDCEMLN
jgi:hypothetical protein